MCRCVLVLVSVCMFCFQFENLTPITKYSSCSLSCRILPRAQPPDHGGPGHPACGSGLHWDGQCLFQRSRSEQVSCLCNCTPVMWSVGTGRCVCQTCNKSCAVFHFSFGVAAVKGTKRGVSVSEQKKIWKVIAECLPGAVLWCFLRHCGWINTLNECSSKGWCFLPFYARK